MAWIQFRILKDQFGEFGSMEGRFGALIPNTRSWPMAAVHFEDWITRKRSLRP